MFSNKSSTKCDNTNLSDTFTNRNLVSFDVRGSATFETSYDLYKAVSTTVILVFGSLWT